MSSFVKLTQHPLTKKYHFACWVDDNYGPHQYGVIFANGDRFPAEAIKKTKEKFGRIKDWTRIYRSWEANQ